MAKQDLDDCTYKFIILQHYHWRREKYLIVECRAKDHMNDNITIDVEQKKMTTKMLT
jgi:hypothetical protein